MWVRGVLVFWLRLVMITEKACFFLLFHQGHGVISFQMLLILYGTVYFSREHHGLAI